MFDDERYKKIYAPVESTWYQQAPYTFKFSGRGNDTKYFNLPISPSNLNITTHFATNVVATMYGTIEEHSEQRYFDINISGTTGMGPKYYMATDDPTSFGRKQPMRAGYTAKITLIQAGSAAAAIARRTKDLINKALDQASEIGNENSAIQSGIHDSANGYMAFHNFYRFLLDYKKKAASGEISSSSHPLQFINFKDNNQYDVSITNFQLMRDQRSPMLYNYSISMRAYNLRSADGSELVSELNLNDLGLGGIKTPAFAKLSNAARKAKNAAYAIVAAAKGLGK
jgi:hypothetical protein